MLGLVGDVHPELASRAIALASMTMSARGAVTQHESRDEQWWVAITNERLSPSDSVASPISFGAGPNDSLGSRVEVEDHAKVVSLHADALGRRMLFVTSLGTTALAFSSELRPLVSLLKSLGVTLTLDLEAWRRYFSLSFMPAPRSPWREIRTVRAGTTLVWRANEGFTREQIAFDIPVDSPNETSTTHDDEAANDLLRLLDEASERLASRQEPALLLSGGLDSAAVATSLASVSPRATALTLDFELESEATLGSTIASHCGLRHERLFISVNDAVAALERTMASLMWPVADPVVVPFTIAAHYLAKQGIKQVWNGEGGDQLFAGWATKPMLNWVRYAKPGDDPAEAYVHTFHKLADIEREALGERFDTLLASDDRVADDVRPYLTGPRAMRHTSFLHRLCEANLWLKGAGNILPRIDQTMASAGLEAISPLLDEALVLRAFRLAPDQKQRGITEKWILRHGLRTR
ncbi:MAG: asparagine synthetase B family protein, partial [Polyangiaceae bacterium]